MRTARLTLAALVAAAVLGGCGSDEEGKQIPTGSASEIAKQLDNIRSQIDNGSPGACDDITSETFPALEAAVASVPGDVDAKVRDALESSIDRLRELVQQECDDIAEQTETAPEQTDTVTIETVPEEPTPTETAPEEPTPTETVPGDEQDGEDGGGTEPGGGTGGGGVPAPGGDE